MTELRWAADGRDAAVVDAIAAVIAQNGPVTLCLPGGATPAPTATARRHEVADLRR